MYTIAYNNEEIYKGEIKETMIELNEILTLFQHKSIITKSNFKWYIGDNILELSIDSNKQLLKPYILYFLIPNNDKLIDTVNNHILTELIVCTEPYLTNIFILLSNLGFTKIDIYQTYVHYLNNTLSKSDNISKPMLATICTNFVQDREDIAEYEKILLYYIKQKKLLFNLKYTPYAKIEN